MDPVSGTPCNQPDTPAEINTNPVTLGMQARCGCGETVLVSGTYDEAAQALASHRASTATPEEGDQ